MSSASRSGAAGEGEGEGEGESACTSTAAITLSEQAIEQSWWGRPDAAAVEVGLEMVGDACEPLVARTTAPFVRAAIGDGVLVLWWPDVGLSTGRHEATVEIIEAERVLVSLAVRVEIFASAPPGSPRRSLMIGIDGMRSDGLARAYTPNMDRLAAVGLWTPEASTQLTGDTVSGPGWTSILTGVEVEKHGADSNGDLHEIDRGYPTFLKRARDGLGLRTAAVCQWVPILLAIIEQDAMDLSTSGDHEQVAEEMAQVLAAGEHDVHFVHFDDVDHAGHRSGFSPENPDYVEAIERVDAAVGQLLGAIVARPDVANEEWLITLTTDHGGEGRGHGPRNQVNRRIPVIIAGPSIASGRLDGFVSHMDPAVTTLAFLGLHPQSAWGLDGRVHGLQLEGRCNDGIDDDGDGAMDCDDEDCQADSMCSGDCPLGALRTPESGQDLAVEASNAGTANLLAGSCGGGDGAEMSWSFVAPWADRWFFETAGSEVDTVLYLLQATGEEGCGGEEIACNDDWFGNARHDVPISNQSALAVDLAEGQEVIVVVDGFRRGAAGGIKLRVIGMHDTCPDMDLGARLGPAVAEGSNTGLPTRLHASCAGAARDTLMSWTAPADGSYVFDTLGSDFDTVLTLHEGACGAELACSDDGGEDYSSRIEIELAAGTELTINVSGFRGRNGAWLLNIRAEN